MSKIRYSHETVPKLESIEEGVFKATTVLLLSGVFSSMYLKNVLDELYASGPYMMISDDTILCHARPNSHVYESFVSYLKTEEAIEYNGKNIHHIFVLGARTTDEHQQLLSRVSRYISGHDTYDEVDMSVAFKRPLEDES